VVLAAVVRAVHLHGDLMRGAISQHGNDFRLGANEAPPAIMSIYVGDQLHQVIDEIVREPSGKLERMPSSLLLGVNSLPPLPRDLSDRNRTSPFAFTGNKFEFRAVGSSQACARPAMILNVIVSESMLYIAEEIEKEKVKGFKLDLAINNVVTRVLKEHQKVIFNGNGYSEDWVIEAEKRGLKNLRTAPEAIKEFSSEKNVKLFEKMKVLSRRELESQQHILYENFSKTVAIEADCLNHMVSAFIVPTCLEYKRTLLATIDTKDEHQNRLLTKYSGLISSLLGEIEKLTVLRQKAKSFSEEELHEQATFYRNQVMSAMIDTRVFVDSLEVLTDDKIWPFPKYSEMLFLK
jgi:glutamine synthetase